MSGMEPRRGNGGVAGVVSALLELIPALRRRRGRFGICGTAVNPRRIAYEQKEREQLGRNAVHRCESVHLLPDLQETRSQV